MRMRYSRLAFTAALIIMGCAKEPQPPVVATDVVVTTPIPGSSMSAGYLSLRNNTAVKLRITRVASPQFARIEIHESTLDNGIARMRRIDELPIPAGDTVVLERGGKHLMLMNPLVDFNSGQGTQSPANNVTLKFYDNDTVVLTVDTRATASLN